MTGKDGARQYFDFVSPTYLENWPAALRRLSIGQVDVPMTVAEATAIASAIWDGPEGHDAELDALEDRIEEALGKFPGGAFARLGSRSPKDAFGGEPRRVTSGRDVMELFFSSERVFDDLVLAHGVGYAPHIFLREWITIPAWGEFRCFMRDGRLVGISQYDYFHRHAEIDEHKAAIEWAIATRFFPRFREAIGSHLPSVVFDVVVRARRLGLGGDLVCDWSVTLLEINPFFERTDPCLFDWTKPEGFDGSLRFVPAPVAGAMEAAR